MRISSINNTTFNPYIRTKAPQIQSPQVSNEQTEGNKNNFYAYPLISFNGGASLDLKLTLKNLRTLGKELEGSIFPPRVEEKAVEVLKGNNPENFRLIDVHKSIFSKIKDCNSLTDIKNLFKEEKFFDDVTSAYDVNFAEGSFADKVLKGESEYFTKDEDLSVQLIKLYWGEGFSLTDLKAYTDGKDINYLLNKLNIPKRNNKYGYYLKFSDEEYNTRITREMTEKRMETLDRIASEAEGEPIYIPRRPLSDEHKQKISEGLIKYYQNNPTACYNISKRQKEFYENHPEQKLIFKEVLRRAWGLKSADRIKQAMRSHFAHAGIKNEKLEFLADPFEMSGNQAKTLKSFWNNNEWARKAHSKNMQYGWKTVKEDLENPTIVFNYPMGLVTDIMEYAESKGVKLNPEDFVTEYDKVTNRHKYGVNFFKIYSEYVNESNNADILASLYQYSLVRSIRNLTKMAFGKEKSKEYKKILDFLTKKYQSQIYELDPKTNKVLGFRELNIDQARTIFINVQVDLRRFDPELETQFLAQLTEDYPIVKAEGLRQRKQ